MNIKKPEEFSATKHEVQHTDLINHITYNVQQNMKYGE